MALEVINESSRMQWLVTYSTIPTIAQYRIDCETTKSVVQDWVTYTPSGLSDTIIVTPEQNRIINSFNPEEQKVLVVMTNADTDAQFVGSVEWVVINLQGVN